MLPRTLGQLCTAFNLRSLHKMLIPLRRDAGVARRLFLSYQITRPINIDTKHKNTAAKRQCYLARYLAHSASSLLYSVCALYTKCSSHPEEMLESPGVCFFRLRLPDRSISIPSIGMQQPIGGATLHTRPALYCIQSALFTQNAHLTLKRCWSRRSSVSFV
jgi:hypothetical protein